MTLTRDKNPISHVKGQIEAQRTLDEKIDQTFLAVKDFGFEALVYDYTPVPYDINGNFIVPSLFKIRNINNDMHTYWFDHEYFKIDPVQKIAAKTITPFFWSYNPDEDTILRPSLNDSSRPVAQYLRDRDITSGITIPIHGPGGDYATVTGIHYGIDHEARNHSIDNIADFSLLAHMFHENAYTLFDSRIRTISSIQITERERECLSYAAEGYSAKEISRFINRSVPTVVMHLNSATKKLGAKNRTQAVVLALNYRLLDNI